MTSTDKKTFALGTDHAGFLYKEAIKDYLLSKGHEVKDFGTFSEDSVDYPEFVKPAARAVGAGICDHGVVLGGSGNGEAMAANKIVGVRCALCWNEESARKAKEHNDANVISIGQRMITEETAINIIKEWLAAEFEGGRHTQRIAMLDE